MPELCEKHPSRVCYYVVCRAGGGVVLFFAVLIDMPRRRKTGRSWVRMFGTLRPETLSGIWAVLLIALSVFLTLAALGNAGVVGAFAYNSLSAILGVGYYLIPLSLFLTAITFLRESTYEMGPVRAIGGALFFVSGIGLIEAILPDRGGIIGGLVASPLIALFDFYTTLLVLIALFVISILITFNTVLRLPALSLSLPEGWSVSSLFAFRLRRKEKPEAENDAGSEEDAESAVEEGEELEPEEKDEQSEPEKESAGFLGGIQLGKKAGAAHAAPALIADEDYAPPPLSLLERDRGKPGFGDIKANANIIKRTLANFGIHVEMDEVSIGPSVTRYALKPAEGVRLSRIVGLQNNLELALAAHPVRIEAPIPGKALVGIEVPNSARSTIGLATLLGGDEYRNTHKHLPVALGRDIAGKAHFADLAKMPHLLIAGATGSGKSVTIHALIASLLFKHGPARLRFIMIDPKRVELTLYNSIPQLLTPVITEPKKAILALKWVAKEMDRRYDILEAERVRDIESYHANVFTPKAKAKPKDNENAPEPMPYIVVVIDELADIMQAYPRELESAIVRLAQMSRAVGIHLILSTQRPSVNVITGLIKANIPARIALQVASQIDSRTILDASGAEKLLGAGDMLYLSGEMSKPHRIQSAYITETEVKKTTSFLAKHNTISLPDDITVGAENGNGDRTVFSADLSMSEDDENEDDLYEEAREIVVHAGKASTSYLQRKLRVGYARAARLMDLLEENGVIGPADGSRPRDVLEGGRKSSAAEDEEEER